MDFISGPVISGFCSAAATTVIVAQFKTLLGLKFPGSSFAKVFPGIFINWRDISLWNTILGLSFIIFLLLLKVNFSVLPPDLRQNTYILACTLPIAQNLTAMKKSCPAVGCLRNRYVDKTLWFVSTCRNALAVILGCVIAYSFELYGYQPFNLTGCFSMPNRLAIRFSCTINSQAKSNPGFHPFIYLHLVLNAQFQIPPTPRIRYSR